MSLLHAKLLASARESQASEQSESRKLQVGSGDRSERIRTYNFPQNRVTDHRINLTLYKLDEIMAGQLDSGHRPPVGGISHGATGRDDDQLNRVRNGMHRFE